MRISRDLGSCVCVSVGESLGLPRSVWLVVVYSIVDQDLLPQAMGLCSLKCLGWCCGTTSVMGIIFLFILGALVSIEVPTIEVDDHQKVASYCYSAGGLYVGFLAISFICCWQAARKEKAELYRLNSN